MAAIEPWADFVIMAIRAIREAPPTAKVTMAGRAKTGFYPADNGLNTTLYWPFFTFSSNFAISVCSGRWHK
jgi:hypothetical protein